MESDFIDFVEYSTGESLKFKELKSFFRCLIAYFAIYLPFNKNLLFDKKTFVSSELDPALNPRIKAIYSFFSFSDFNRVSEYLNDHDWWWTSLIGLNKVKISPYHLSYFHEMSTVHEKKKSTGGYFSPREQVEFICKCCFYESLQNDEELEIEKHILRQLIFQGRVLRFTSKEIEKLLEKIRKLLIVDPSCGCGTFLYEMGNLICSILALLLKNGNISSTEYMETFEASLLGMKGYDIDDYHIRITKFSLFYLWNQAAEKNSYGKMTSSILEFCLPTDIIHSDFLKDISLQENSVDIICTNPPFIRHHEFNKYSIIEKLKSSSELNIAFKGAKVDIDAKGDIYLYFILKSLLLLKPKGVFGFILSRSWYSSRFSAPMFQLLNNKYFWMKLILETPYEPWQNAEIRTNITIGQKHSGNFVNGTTSLLVWKKSFKELLEEYGDLSTNVAEDHHEDFLHSGKYKISLLESEGFYRYQIDDSHILFSKNRSSWFPINRLDYMLLPPIVLNEILLNNKEKFCLLSDLGQLSLGSTTGANKFFYLDKKMIQEYNFPGEFLIPMTKSPKDSITLNKISSKKKKFLLHIPSSVEPSFYPELQAYISENKKSIYSRPYFKNKKENSWFRIRLSQPDLMIPNMTYLRSFVTINKGNYHIDKQWIGFWSKEESWLYPLLGFFNSSLGVLLREVQGTRTLGLGSLKLSLKECKDLLILDPRKMSNTTQEEIAEIITKMVELPLLKIGEKGLFREYQIQLDDIFNQKILKLSQASKEEIVSTIKFFVEWRLGRKIN